MTKDKGTTTPNKRVAPKDRFFLLFSVQTRERVQFMESICVAKNSIALFMHTQPLNDHRNNTHKMRIVMYRCAKNKNIPKKTLAYTQHTKNINNNNRKQTKCAE